jgi:hypothetical protein
MLDSSGFGAAIFVHVVWDLGRTWTCSLNWSLPLKMSMTLRLPVDQVRICEYTSIHDDYY